MKEENNVEEVTPETSEPSWYDRYGPKNPMTGEPLVGTGGDVYSKNQERRDAHAAASAERAQNSFDNRLNRARDRRAAGKKVWNRNMRNIIDEEEATQTSSY